MGLVKQVTNRENRQGLVLTVVKWDIGEGSVQTDVLMSETKQIDQTR